MNDGTPIREGRTVPQLFYLEPKQNLALKTVNMRALSKQFLRLFKKEKKKKRGQ